MKIRILIIMILVWVNPIHASSQNGFVKLTSVDGREINARIISKSEDRVTIERVGGGRFNVEIKQFSDDSKNYISSWVSPYDMAVDYLSEISVVASESLGHLVDPYYSSYSLEQDPGKDGGWDYSTNERIDDLNKLKSAFLEKMIKYSDPVLNPESGKNINRVSLLDLIEVMHLEEEGSEFPLRIIYGNLNTAPKGYFHPPFGTKQPVSLLAKKTEVYKKMEELLLSDDFSEFKAFFESIEMIYLEIQKRVEARDSPYFKTQERLPQVSRNLYRIFFEQ